MGARRGPAGGDPAGQHRWLLNVRGSDVPMNPVPRSLLLLDADNRLAWFVDRRKLGNDLDTLSPAGMCLPRQRSRPCARAAGSSGRDSDPTVAPTSNGIYQRAASIER